MAVNLVSDTEFFHVRNHKTQDGLKTSTRHQHNSYLRGHMPEQMQYPMKIGSRPHAPSANASLRDAKRGYPLPTEFLDASCEVTKLSEEHRVYQLEETMLLYIQEIHAGAAQWVVDSIAQTHLQEEAELMSIARIVVSKALDEPQLSEACAVLSKVLQTCLPAVPPTRPGKKAEGFMHAVLDAFQTEFEHLLVSPTAPSEGKTAGLSFCGMQASPTDQRTRLRAAVEFAGNLHRQGLLGTRVVDQIVHDLLSTGAPLCARELLLKIGVVLDTDERTSLSTVVEASSDTDGEAS